MDAVIAGHAFAVKKGCPAARYAVRAGYGAVGGMQSFRLEGAAPVRSRTSCESVGEATDAANARQGFRGAWA